MRSISVGANYSVPSSDSSSRPDPTSGSSSGFGNSYFLKNIGYGQGNQITRNIFGPYTGGSVEETADYKRGGSDDDIGALLEQVGPMVGQLMQVLGGGQQVQSKYGGSGSGSGSVEGDGHGGGGGGTEGAEQSSSSGPEGGQEQGSAVEGGQETQGAPQSKEGGGDIQQLLTQLAQLLQQLLPMLQQLLGGGPGAQPPGGEAPPIVGSEAPPPVTEQGGV